MTAPRIVAVVPEGLMAEFFSDEDITQLGALAENAGRFVRVDGLDEVDDTTEIVVLITSWGIAPLTAEVLDRLPRLRLIAHTGATVRPFATDELFDRDVPLTQAGAGMARSVAEVSIAFTLALLHRIPQMHDAIRTGVWFDGSGAQHEILGAPIAVIGASRTGRAYLELLRGLGARPLLVDPTVDAAEATRLGAELLPLDEALTRARIVALHAPSLPATHRMLGARQLALMPDGAGVVNTARSWLVDEAALLAELSSGRLFAAIDVFDEEPLPPESPFRRVRGALLTPHRAAGTTEGRLRQGRIVVDEIEAFLDDRPLLHRVHREHLSFMA